MSTTSHVEHLLKAIEKLPEEGKQVITALYRTGMTEEQACQHFKIKPEDLAQKHSQALRALMSAVH